jgi:hypothetical protein
MSCRHWLLTMKQTPPRTPWQRQRELSIIRDCDTQTYRIWCDEEGPNAYTNCVDLTPEQLREFAEKALAIANSHQPWPVDD